MGKLSKAEILAEAPDDIVDLSTKPEFWWMTDDGVDIEGEEPFRLVGVYDDVDDIVYLAGVRDMDTDEMDYDEGSLDDWTLDQLWSWWESGSMKPFRQYMSLAG